MNSDIIEAITQIAKDKKIERENLRDMLEYIFSQMIIKKYGTDENFDIIVNIEKGDVEIFQEKTVVETVEDPVLEIDLESARKIDPDAELGEDFVEIVNPESFGRRLIVTAKQSLNQKIRDFEREHILAEYRNRLGEIIIGDIHQINRKGMFINVEKTEVFLPRSEQIYNERLRRGDTVRAIIKSINEENKGTEIIVSRADKQFLIRLFELEVPEIYDGIIDVKKVAREAGDRSKIAVESIDRRVDAVGACVGMKGVRIQAVVKELNNEKIDIINYTSEPSLFVTRAMTPAKPTKVMINEEENLAVVIIPDTQMALAIGRNGQNLRLASKLTGYQIEPVKQSEYELQISEQYVAVEDIEEIPAALKTKLLEADVTNKAEIIRLGLEGLLDLPGIGPKSAEKLMDIVSASNDSENKEDAGDKDSELQDEVAKESEKN